MSEREYIINFYDDWNNYFLCHRSESFKRMWNDLENTLNREDDITVSCLDDLLMYYFHEPYDRADNIANCFRSDFARCFKNKNYTLSVKKFLDLVDIYLLTMDMEQSMIEVGIIKED